jgi:hypothetical protein
VAWTNVREFVHAMQLANVYEKAKKIKLGIDDDALRCYDCEAEKIQEQIDISAHSNWLSPHGSSRLFGRHSNEKTDVHRKLLL